MKIIHGTQDYINGFKAGYAIGCEDVTFSIINHVVMGKDNEDRCIDIMTDFIESASLFEAKVISDEKPKKLINGRCQTCGKAPCTDGDFCCFCGKRIDWSVR